MGDPRPRTHREVVLAKPVEQAKCGVLGSIYKFAVSLRGFYVRALMTTLLLAALSWWPFHHHKQPIPQSVGVITDQGVVHFPDSSCDHDEHGFWFLGPDNMIGLAKESCDAAFSDWRTSGKGVVADHTI